ncbi:hypothetical protein [Rhizobium leguminosarum]|uniref:hypothetical protein n=1 Tax=Rhizobium leguminosarum TaxID=384 RepID=UPI001FDFB860|nr:hypothetical protein [Rhizobium leguminosarum]
MLSLNSESDKTDRITFITGESNSGKAIAYVTSAPPEGIAWLTPAKAQAMAITYDAIDEDAPIRHPRRERRFRTIPRAR